MSLEMIDGFDNYNSQTNLNRKWSLTAPASSNLGFPAGRFPGGQAMSNGNIGPAVPLTAVATRIIGFAFKSALFNQPIVQYLDAGSVQVDLRTTATGQLQVTRNGTVLGTSALTLLLNIWTYIEFSATIDPVTGAYTVRVTEGSKAPVVWLTGSGANTRATANSTTNQLILPITNGGAPHTFDDLYILNTAGTVNNAFLGECRIYSTLPTGNGLTTAWTPSAGASNVLNVKEANPNDDTDYNSSLTPGQIDLYTSPAIAPIGAVAGVQLTTFMRKDDVGTRQVSIQYRAGATTTQYTAATVLTPGSQFQADRTLYDTDPDTGLAWTLAAVNNAQFGVKCIA